MLNSSSLSNLSSPSSGQELWIPVASIHKNEEWCDAANKISQLATFPFNKLVVNYSAVQGYAETNELKSYVRALNKHLKEHLSKGLFDTDCLPILQALSKQPESLASVMNLLIERFTRVSTLYSRCLRPEDYEAEIQKFLSYSNYLTQVNDQTESIMKWAKSVVQIETELWDQKKVLPHIRKLTLSILKFNPDQKLPFYSKVNFLALSKIKQLNTKSPLHERGASQEATQQRILEIASQQGI